MSTVDPPALGFSPAEERVTSEDSQSSDHSEKDLGNKQDGMKEFSEDSQRSENDLGNKQDGLKVISEDTQSSDHSEKGFGEQTRRDEVRERDQSFRDG